jgi:hypothetical protein
MAKKSKKVVHKLCIDGTISLLTFSGKKLVVKKELDRSAIAAFLLSNLNS